MQEVQLYINGERVELFKEETISLTSTIQDVRDIGSVFTDFSYDFIIPASKVNNKILKHYYNFDLNNGFDARFKADALIKLNGFDFRKGKIRLLSVGMKNNSPSTYKLVFFGETIKMTEMLGDDELSSLIWLDRFNHEYNQSLVHSGFKTGLYYNGSTMVENAIRDVVYPLISHTNILIYDSTAEGTALPDTTNTYAISGTNGISYTDLKPAIRLKHIITAIQQKYGITFSTDFFGTSVFTDLFMLLHRDKGGLYAGVGENNVKQNYSINTQWSDAKNNIRHDLTFNVVVGASSGIYKISVYDINTNEKIDEQSGLSGDKSFVYSLESDFGVNKDWNIEFKISTTSASFPSVTLNLLDVETIVVDTVETIVNHNFTSGLLLMVSKIFTRDQMPKMKIIDFLSSIFKMFNLTAYYENNIIVVKTLDDYYAIGKTHDITKYIDVGNSDVSKTMNYSNISFKYEKPKTNLILARAEILNEEYGNSYWAVSNTFDGTKYGISVGFEKLLFERLNNKNGGSLTNVGYGLLVDRKLSPTSTAPIIFYNVNQIVDTVNNKIGFKGVGVMSTYNRPSNSIEDGSRTINFNSEIDEWSLITNFNSLFEKYYKNYITNVFDIKSRIVKMTSFLPLSILLKYRLNDIFIISGKKYRINSISTTLQNGKSELELINEGLVVVDTEIPTTPLAFTSSNQTGNQLTLTWNASSDNVGVRGYQVYKDGVLYKDTTSLTTIVTGLAVSTTYSFKVRSYDNSGNYSAFTSDLVVLFSAGTDVTAPTIPTQNSLVQNIGNIYVSWSASSDASGVTNYLVYKKIGAGAYSLYQTLGVVLNYTDTSVSTGNTYYYKITAKDAVGNESGYSNEASLSYLADTTAPTTPTGLNATEPSSLTVSLTWNASTDASGIKHYEIHRSKDGAGYIQLNTSLTNSYTDTEVILDSNYCYKVRAVDNWDNISAFSNIDCELVNIE